MREASLGATVKNQLVYDTLQTQYTAMAREYAYILLNDNTNLINMGDTSDYVYQAFFNSMQTSDAAHYLNARIAMDTNNLTVAQTELNLIVDTNAINHNRIIVGNIYLNTWAQDNYRLTDVQVRTLTDIAYLDPNTNGDGVYTARVMLNINPDYENNQNKSLQQFPKSVIKSNTVHVYPNPAKESVTIAFDQPISGEGSVEIWSIIGNELLLNTIPLASYKQIVNVSSLTSGIYFYVIKVNGDRFSSGKLIILNK